MGCDIHFYVEKRVNGSWEPADKWEKEDDGEGGTYDSVNYNNRFYSDRNYNLFSILADVRNGVGFAGCRTGAGFNPISMPKGLPEDVSDIIRGCSDRWGCDGHSHSWLTVAEVMSYDWTQVTLLTGWVDVITYWKWNQWDRTRGEGPKEYCGGVSGPGVAHLGEQAMLAICKQADEICHKQNYAAAESWLATNHKMAYAEAKWETPYFKQARAFLSQTLPRMWRLGKPEDVRAVFWFDN